MARAWISLALVLTLVVGATCPATAGETSSKTKVKRTVKEAAKTGGHAARDGALTFGRSTRDFFTGGPDAAKKTWHENAARTKANAKAGASRTRAAAHGQNE